MVNNLNNILDEGQEKFIENIIMEAKHVGEFRDKIDYYRNLQREKTRQLLVGNVEASNRIYIELEEMRSKDEYLWNHVISPDWDKLIKDSAGVCKSMGIIPFIPCVMFNISPHWKGKFNVNPVLDQIMVKKFREVIEKYLNSNNRYSNYKYCLESGSDGSFLHAHIVAEINPKTNKSVKTHIGKGNHSGELKKHMDKIFSEMKGYEGLLKGKFSVQRILINNREIKEDKLNYLEEENKTDGHRNLNDLRLVFGGGF